MLDFKEYFFQALDLKERSTRLRPSQSQMNGSDSLIKGYLINSTPLEEKKYYDII